MVDTLHSNTIKKDNCLRVDITITADASELGQGTTDGQHVVGGKNGHQTKNLVLLHLKVTMGSGINLSTLRLNVTAIQLNNIGGNFSKQSNRLSKEIWEF